MKNVIIIDGDRSIPLREEYLTYTGLDIKAAEIIENELEAKGVKYLLIQAEIPYWKYVSQMKDRLVKDKAYHILTKSGKLPKGSYNETFR